MTKATVLLLFAAGMVAGPALAGEGARVEFHGSAGEAMRALPFSESVRVGDLLLLSGQVGVNPETAELVPGGIEAEARQTMDNIRSVLERRGLGMADIVKCTVMLADIGDYRAFNRVYSGYFDGRYPARSAFAASGLALGARVEVECIAAIPGGES